MLTWTLRADRISECTACNEHMAKAMTGGGELQLASTGAWTYGVRVDAQGQPIQWQCPEHATSLPPHPRHVGQRLQVG
jgi:hypothetical protein